MPFFKFHFVEASRMAGVSRRMADRLQAVSYTHLTLPTT